jgi:FMN phosphatase YigB (HAD superfamily)
VFDTLITRTTWRPEDLFLILGQRLQTAGLLRGSAEDLAQARISAEAALRAEPGVEEVRLGEIHRALAKLFGWDERQTATAAALEVEVEEAAIRPVAAMVAQLGRIQAGGAEVALLSDTYLDHPALLRLLRRAGIAVPPDRVFASSALDATKRTGRMFATVAERLGVAPGAIVHRGDHPTSDLAVPRLAGVRAELCTEAAPTRHEHALYAGAGGHPPLLRSLVAGAARAARLSVEPRQAHEHVLWSVGATVAGPLLAGFVLWVLCRARAAEATRVHFVARDGQVLKQIAETLLPRLGWPIECRYLLGSRQAWHLPALDGLDEVALSWIVEGAGQEKLRSVLARAELAPEPLAGALARHGLDGAGQLDQPPGRERLRALLADAEVGEALRAASLRRRATALGYLRQEGVIGGPSAMIVDIGWHGRLQRSLRRLVELGAEDGATTKLSGLYLALRSRPAGFEPSEMQAFIEDPAFLRSLNPVLFEIFCAADHGTVRGYRGAADGRYEGVLAEAEDRRVLDWGLRSLHGGILAFARELGEAMALADEARPEAWLGPLRSGGIAAYDAFRREPDAAEAEAFGSFPHADGQAHDAWGECAPRINSLQQLRLGLGLGDASYAGHWPEASLRRSGGGLAEGLLTLKRLRRRVLATG